MQIGDKARSEQREPARDWEGEQSGSEAETPM